MLVLSSGPMACDRIGYAITYQVPCCAVAAIAHGAVAVAIGIWNLQRLHAVPGSAHLSGSCCLTCASVGLPGRARAITFVCSMRATIVATRERCRGF